MSNDKPAVGDRAWVFDSNRRVYDSATGNGGAVYAKHWKEGRVTRVGRTQVDIDGRTFRRDNRGVYTAHASHVVFTEQEMIDDVWRHNNYTAVLHAAQNAPASALRQVAALLGVTSRGEDDERRTHDR